MNEAYPADISTADRFGKPVSIRVAPNGYFSALLLFTFASAFLIYIDLPAIGLGVLAVALITIPFLAYFDRIKFDGRRLSRTGLLPGWWAWANSSRRGLRLGNVEQVETQALRAMKRGRNIYYRYRTSVRGKGVVLTFSSGGGDYRRMASTLFTRLPENVLDNRSIEIRDYLADPRSVLATARSSHIPSSDVLETSLKEFRVKRTYKPKPLTATNPAEEAPRLRRLANQLRLSGFLLPALEAFRRAVLLRPNDAWLWLEFGRCMHSLAGSEKDEKLNRRSIAMMRLAERHAGSDGALLARLGESYYQAGELQRSASVFQKAISAVGDNFRSARGLAEIALRQGKIAHVIHNFSAANRSVDVPALRRWSKDEADYFARLNDDDEYMEMELGRVSLLEKLENGRRSCLRIAFFGMPCILIGVLTEEFMIANVGWSVSIAALSIWIVLTLGRQLLSSRIPFDVFDKDREES